MHKTVFKFTIVVATLKPSTPTYPANTFVFYNIFQGLMCKNIEDFASTKIINSSMKLLTLFMHYYRGSQSS